MQYYSWSIMKHTCRGEGGRLICNLGWCVRQALDRGSCNLCSLASGKNCSECYLLWRCDECMRKSSTMAKGQSPNISESGVSKFRCFDMLCLHLHEWTDRKTQALFLLASMEGRHSRSWILTLYWSQSKLWVNPRCQGCQEHHRFLQRALGLRASWTPGDEVVCHEAISACEKGGEWLPVLQLLQQMMDEHVERCKWCMV